MHRMLESVSYRRYVYAMPFSAYMSCIQNVLIGNASTDGALCLPQLYRGWFKVKHIP